jgi:hypothetical protein
MNRRRKGGLHARGPRVLGLLLALAPWPVFAQSRGPISTQSLFFDQASNVHQGNYLEVDAGVLYSDNVYLRSGSPGDTLAVLGLVGDASRRGTRLDYRVDSDIALVKYLHSEFQTQPFGYFDGSATLQIVPGIFSWLARETYNQTAINAFTPINPDNLESINYITTGPRFTLRPTLRTTIIANATYSYVDSSSKSPQYVNINNHRYGSDITLSRAFSNILSAYVTGSSQKVEFTDQVNNTNFREDEALAGFKVTDARTELDVSAGYIKLHDQNQSPSGSTWRVELARLISPTQRVSVHALKQVTDASQLFRLNINAPVPTNVPTRIASGQPFTDREYGATWRFQENRTSFQLDVLAVSQRYQATPGANFDATVVSAQFGRQLSPVLNWDVGANYEHNSNASGKLDSVNAITSLRWQVGLRLGLRFIYAHSTTSPHGYGENQVGIMASYALLPAAAAGPQAGETRLHPIDPMSSQQPRR